MRDFISPSKIIVALAVFCLLASCGTKNKPDSMEEASNKTGLVLHLHVSNTEIVKDSSIELSIYILNESDKPITILRGRSRITSISAPGWKSKDIKGFVYNGPATSTVAPTDSAYFGYNDIKEFFDSIDPGERILSVEYTVFVQGHKDPIVLSSSVPINVK
jgi:hypothetical protein